MSTFCLLFQEKVSPFRWHICVLLSYHVTSMLVSHKRCLYRFFPLVTKSFFFIRLSFGSLWINWLPFSFLLQDAEQNMHKKYRPFNWLCSQSCMVPFQRLRAACDYIWFLILTMCKCFTILSLQCDLVMMYGNVYVRKRYFLVGSAKRMSFHQ